eukprot:4358339-Pleurochrysis_carterae.AAC.2
MCPGHYGCMTAALTPASNLISVCMYSLLGSTHTFVTASIVHIRSILCFPTRAGQIARANESSCGTSKNTNKFVHNYIAK